MTTKTKTFDCVEMKQRIQDELRAEYESRTKEFANYIDFLQAKANESPWVRQQRQRFAGKQPLLAQCGQAVEELEELDDIRAYDEAKAGPPRIDSV
jgi:hypothetical protein